MNTKKFRKRFQYINYYGEPSFSVQELMGWWIFKTWQDRDRSLTAENANKVLKILNEEAREDYYEKEAQEA